MSDNNIPLSDTMLNNNQQTHKETDSVVRYPHITYYQKLLSDPILSNSPRYKNVLLDIIFEVTSGCLVVNDCLPDINPFNDIALMLTTFIAKNDASEDKRKVLVMTIDSTGIIGVHGVIHGPSDDLLFGQGLGFTQEPDGRYSEIHITGDETSYEFSLNDEYNLQPLDNELHITKWVGLLNFFKDSGVSIIYHLGPTTNLVQQTVETTTPTQDDQPGEQKAVTLDILIEERIEEIKAKLSEISTQQETALESIRNLNKLQLQVSTELNHLYNLKATRESKE